MQEMAFRKMEGCWVLRQQIDTRVGILKEIANTRGRYSVSAYTPLKNQID
jgi:hypothetical protein